MSGFRFADLLEGGVSIDAPIEDPDCENARQKRRVLKSYSELKIVKDALAAHKVSRYRFQRWVNEDPQFRVKLGIVYDEITDEIERIALKKTGVLKMADDDEAARLKGWADNKLLIDLMKIRKDRPDTTTIQNLTLNITGLDMNKLNQLTAPITKPKEQQNRIAEIIPAETVQSEEQV